MVGPVVHIIIVPVLEDNYSYIIAWESIAFVVDPGEARPVIDALTHYNLKLEGILLTHHHHDHVGGVSALKKISDCDVLGPPGSSPELNKELHAGSHSFGVLPFEVLAVPGHTLDHLAYYFPLQKALFSGDALFGAGTGRLFEGTVDQMLGSLETIRALPHDTKVYCGHEYTLKNLEFAQLIEPNNARVQERLEAARRLREEGQPTIPSTLALEVRTNPFLRLSVPSIGQTIGIEEGSDRELFAELRRRRNDF